MSRRGAALALVILACAPAACSTGSGDRPPAAGVVTASPEGTPGSPENPLTALPSPEGTRVPPDLEAGEAARGEAAAPAGDDAPSPAIRQPRSTVEETAATRRRAGPKKLLAGRPSLRRPCSLVTRAQAQEAVGTALLAPFEAPQGPTCIYRAKTGNGLVTLSVQSIDVAKLKPQLRDRRAVVAAGRTGWCGSHGRPMLYVPLSARRVLSIAAPCPVARRLADVAAVPGRRG